MALCKKSNDNKSNTNNRGVNMTDKIWLVIEKSTYGNSGSSYTITKTAETIEKAVSYKTHLDALNESKHKCYFIASDIETVMNKVIYHHNKAVDEKPLVLKDEVKETSSDMPF